MAALTGVAKTTLIVALSAISLLIIDFYIALAYWSFPQADDFDFAALGRDAGVFGGALTKWQLWSGRVSSNLINMTVGTSFLFPFHTGWFVMASIGLFAISLFHLLRKVTGGHAALALADIAMLFLLLPAFVRKEAFYWLDGNITYLLPVSLVCLVMTGFDRPAPPGYERAACAALFLFFLTIGSFNEQFSIILIGSMGGYLLIRFADRREQFYKRLLFCALGILLGFAFDYFAPGSQLRRDMVVEGHPLGLLGSAKVMLHGMYSISPSFAGLFLLYGLLRACFTDGPPRAIPGDWQRAAGCMLLALGGIAVTLFVVVYGYNMWVVLGRTFLLFYLLIFLSALLLAQWAVHKTILPVGRFREPVMAALLVSLALLCLPQLDSSFHKLAKDIQDAPEVRQRVERQFDQAMRARQQHPGSTATVIVDPIGYERHMLVFVPVATDASSRRNEMFSDYFGLKSVSSMW